MRNIILSSILTIFILTVLIFVSNENKDLSTFSCDLTEEYIEKMDRIVPEFPIQEETVFSMKGI